MLATFDTQFLAGVPSGCVCVFALLYCMLVTLLWYRLCAGDLCHLSMLLTTTTDCRQGGILYTPLRSILLSSQAELVTQRTHRKRCLG